MSGRGGQVRHSVSFVLELWDDFMDRPISDASLDVYTEDVRVEVSVEDDSALWRLLSDYDAEKTPDQMELFNPFEKELEGRRFYIRDREGNKEDFFQIGHQEGRTGVVRLAEALAYGYKKAGTKLYECSSTRADADGTFQIPLKVRTQGKKEILCRIGIDGRVYEVWVEPGKTVQWEQPQGQA